MGSKNYSEVKITRRYFLSSLVIGGTGLALLWRFNKVIAAKPVEPRQPGDAERIRDALRRMDVDEVLRLSDKAHNFQWIGPTSNEMAKCSYSFDSTNMAGVSYRVEACAKKDKITYIVSELPLYAIYSEKNEILSELDSFRTAIKWESNSLSEKEETDLTNQFLIVSGEFLFLSCIRIYPGVQMKDNAMPAGTRGLFIIPRIISKRGDYNVDLRCLSSDGSVFFSDSIEKRPTFKSRKEEYMIGNFRSNMSPPSDVFFVPENILVDGLCKIIITYDNKGGFDKIPDFAKIQTLLIN